MIFDERISSFKCQLKSSSREVSKPTSTHLVGRFSCQCKPKKRKKPKGKGASAGPEGQHRA